MPPPQKAVHFVQEVQGPTLQSTAEMIKSPCFLLALLFVGIIEVADSFTEMLYQKLFLKKKNTKSHFFEKCFALGLDTLSSLLRYSVPFC